jgi:cell division septation protein DedD
LSEPLSNKQLKNRLLGAGLLVLLAVVIIPLFLGDPRQLVEESSVPQSTIFESKIQPLPSMGSNEESGAESRDKEIESSGGLVLKKLDDEQPEKASKSVTIQPLNLSKLDSSSGAIKKPVAKTAPVKVAKTKKVSSTQSKDKIKSGWAVQAGIFSKIENANTIAGMLKSNGYAPNISDAKASFGKAKRVWIGPFATKSEAQAVSKRLEQKTGNGGYVAVFPFKS